MKPLLDIKNLNVRFKSKHGTFHAVKDLSLILNPSETLAIVGESGSGKSTIAHAILKLLPEKNSSTTGHILFQNQDLEKLHPEQLRQIRGEQIGIVFQDPLTALNPTMKIGKQILETIFAHHKADKKKAYQKILQVLSQVGFDNPEDIYHLFPFQLSGGMRQRAIIAQAIINEPKLLIADEPTTALDADLRIQVLDLLKSLQQQMQMGLLLISHDLKLVSRVSDRVAVMQHGKIVETNPSVTIFQTPQHDYTKLLLNACVYKRENICSK
jgi:ABC-type dipeptide/oligopeptide/nickel transport system ATPase component